MHIILFHIFYFHQNNFKKIFFRIDDRFLSIHVIGFTKTMIPEKSSKNDLKF